jgi:rhodanese-related sulfurtransferase
MISKQLKIILFQSTLLYFYQWAAFMISETIDNKKLSIIAFIFIVTGCTSQEPDNLKMIPATELNRIMQNEDIFLVDVHTPEQQHIKGTDLFIPYNEIEKYQDKLPKDKNTAIYLYCEGGPMGNAAAKSLHDLGYRNVTNLEGGAKAWRAAGFNLE